MYRLADCQKTLVSEVLEAVHNNEKEIIIESPTGSGKTTMAGQIAQDILQDSKAKVFFCTIPKNNLFVQAYKGIKAGKEHFGWTNIEEAMIGVTTKFEDVKCDIIEGKKNFITMSTMCCKTDSGTNSKITDANMDRMFAKLKEDGNKLYFFVDEAHFSYEHFLEIIKKYASCVIYVTATPDIRLKEQCRNNNYFGITPGQALKANLIVNAKYCDDYNDMLVEKNSTIFVQEDISDNNYVHYVKEAFKEALSKFIKDLYAVRGNYAVFEQEVKKLLGHAYKMQATGVIPCACIQISNGVKGDNEKNAITALLDRDYPDITYVYTDSDKTVYSRNYKGNIYRDFMEIVNESDGPDIVIFKQKVAEGADIPRCHVLMQMRQTVSQTLTQQVAGRALRNPYVSDMINIKEELDDYFEKVCELFDKYIYSVFYGISVEETYYRPVYMKICAEFESFTTSFEPLKVGHFTREDLASYLVEAQKLNDKKLLKKQNVLPILDFIYRTTALDGEEKKKLSDYAKELITSNIMSEQTVYSYLNDAMNMIYSTTDKRADKKVDVKRVATAFKKKQLSQTHGMYTQMPNSVVQLDVDALDKLDEPKGIIYDSDKGSFYYRNERSNKEVEVTENTVPMDSKAEIAFVDDILMKLYEKDVFDEIDGYTLYFKNPVFAHAYGIKFNMGTQDTVKYPDFVFRTTEGIWYLIEVRSYNYSQSQKLDFNKYMDKTQRLKEVIKYACEAKKAKNICYAVAELIDNKWTITTAHDSNVNVYDSKEAWLRSFSD